MGTGPTQVKGEPRRRFTYAASQAVIRLIVGTTCGLKYEGAGDVPQEGPLLLAANHKSYLDPPVVGAGLPREIRYFAKKQLFGLPLFGRLISHFGAIPVDRDNFDRRGLVRALELLRGGDALLVFPEGTRIRRSGFAEPKEGIGMLARKAGVPVVPVYIEASWDPRRSLTRRIPIRVRFGRPMVFSETDGSGREAYGEITRRVMAAIRELAAPSSSPPQFPG